jgi:CII-binding regulator of phage lambda lysogenization HflD
MAKLVLNLQEMFNEFLDKLAADRKQKNKAMNIKMKLKERILKVDEYKQMINVMQTQIDEEKEHYKNVIKYMGHYYEEVVATMSLR